MSGPSAFVALDLEASSRRRRSGAGGKAKTQVEARNGRSAARAGKRAHPGRAFKGTRKGRVWGQRPGRTVSTLGGRLQAVAKSRFVRNTADARRHLSDYLDYVQNRERAEFEKERTFFTKDRSNLDQRDIENEIRRYFGREVAFHKIIVSPGDNSVNLQHYVRETMKEWEKELGYELKYWAVPHLNTDHYHAHVIIGGRSGEGERDVRLYREDLAALREAGNEYLARERMLDRSLDRQVEVEFDTRDMHYYDVQIQKDLGLTWFREWKDQVEIGLRTDYDYAKEMRELGLDRIYDLGRPFQTLDKVDPELGIITNLYDRRAESDCLQEDSSVPPGRDDWDKDMPEDIYRIASGDFDHGQDDSSRFAQEAPDMSRFVYDDERTDEPGGTESREAREETRSREDRGDRDDEEKTGRGDRGAR